MSDQGGCARLSGVANGLIPIFQAMLAPNEQLAADAAKQIKANGPTLNRARTVFMDAMAEFVARRAGGNA